MDINKADNSKEASQERKRGHDGLATSGENDEEKAILEHNTFTGQMAEGLEISNRPSYDVVDMQLQHIYTLYSNRRPKHGAYG
jgi:hypothetical protein